MKNNKGMTLVELIISVAILSIVGIAIFGFMTTTSKIYGKEVSQADLQYEAQLAVNQLQDLLIDATQGVNYSVLADGTETSVLSDSGIDEAKVTEKYIAIANDSDRYIVTWNKADQKLYYTKEVKKIVGGTVTWEPSATTRVLMADYVREFSADLTNLEKSYSIQFRFLFGVNNVTYATRNNITLRNKVVVGVDAGVPIPVVDPKQDSIEIFPKVITIWPGDELYYTHLVKSNTGAYPSQDADYSMSGNLSSSTVLGSDNVLKAAVDETSPTINVTVTARHGNGVAGAPKPSDVSTVSIKIVEGISVAFTDGGSYTGKAEERLIAGSTLQFKVDSISGINIFPQDLAEGNIVWSMEKGADYVTIDESGMAKVSVDAPIDTVFQPKAAFYKDGRELAVGLGNEYMVVAVKEQGAIYVDDEKWEYVAPPGEIWYPEKQWIAVEWDKIPSEYKRKDGDGNSLDKSYTFRWSIGINDGELKPWKGEGHYFADLKLKDKGGDTSNAGMSLELMDWMQVDNQFKKIRIQLMIYSVPSSDSGQNGKPIWYSNIIELEAPKIFYMYSYTKDGPFSKELPVMVTNRTKEAYVYYYIYGYLNNDKPDWMNYTNFRVSNDRTNLNTYGSSDDKFLNIDLDNKMIYFKPKTKTGNSKVQHKMNTGDYDSSNFTIYFNNSNIEKADYYVPIPRTGDTAYKDSGYLYGDCSYKISTQESIPSKKKYYKLEITDKSVQTVNPIVRFCASGESQWVSDENKYYKQ